MALGSLEEILSGNLCGPLLCAGDRGGIGYNDRHCSHMKSQTD